MKLAGTHGICPVFNGIKCTSINDFAGYFEDEMNTHTKMLNEIKTQLDLISNSLLKLEIQEEAR